MIIYVIFIIIIMSQSSHETSVPVVGLVAYIRQHADEDMIQVSMYYIWFGGFQVSVPYQI